MEELQDAIEDAQYVNAIATQEDGPRPVLAWEKPSPEALESWEQTKLESDPAAFDLTELLKSAIPLFLFSSYIKTQHDDYLRINFCEDIIRYKKARGKTKLEMGHRIANRYLTKADEIKPPSRTEIHECDLCRLPSPSALAPLEEASFMEAMDYPECTESYVGLKGSVREEVCRAWLQQEKAERTRKVESNSVKSAAVEAAQQVETEGRTEDENNNESGSPEESALGASQDQASKMRSSGTSISGMSATESMRSLTRKFKSSASILRDDVFDLAEAIVMESLKKEYWQGFLESEEYAKLKNFMWYGDRRVVPDDFFVMRVLGRGGFGLVTGRCTVFSYPKNTCAGNGLHFSSYLRAFDLCKQLVKRAHPESSMR